MKKTLVRLSNGEEVSGWQTDVPGLVACAYQAPTWRATDKRWLLVHADSGWRVATLDKRAECASLAERLAPLADWTQHSTKITGKDMHDRIMPALREWFDERRALRDLTIDAVVESKE